MATLWGAVKVLEDRINGLEAEAKYWREWAYNHGWADSGQAFVGARTKEKAPPVFAGEPRTDDYCGICGESPDSGTHLFKHEWGR